MNPIISRTKLIPVCFVAWFGCVAALAVEIHLVPRPVSLKVEAGELGLGAQTVIVAPSELATAACYLAGVLASTTGFELPTIAPSPASVPGAIELRLGAACKQWGDEGYSLTVSPAGAGIEAATPAGVFHGIQTLRQLLPLETVSQAPAEGNKWNIPIRALCPTPKPVGLRSNSRIGIPFNSACRISLNASNAWVPGSTRKPPSSSRARTDAAAIAGPVEAATIAAVSRLPRASWI